MIIDIKEGLEKIRGRHTSAIAGVLKKADRDDRGIISLEKYDMLISELGDVLWYVANVPDYLGIGLGELGDLNIKKLQSRASSDTIKGSGDNR